MRGHSEVAAVKAMAAFRTQGSTCIVAVPGSVGLPSAEASGEMGSAGPVRRLFGIRPRVHYTWLFAMGLITAAIVTQFSTFYPLWQRLALGAAGTVLFFLSVIFRESLLAFLATRKGIATKSITFFVFGGLHEIDGNTTAPALELLMAVFGQLSNLITAGLFTAAYFLLVHTGNIVVDVLMQWLAFIWFMLAIFHFAPGFPLDGGRAFRALVWRLTGSYQKATRVAAWTGWVTGLMMVGGGIAFLVVAQEWFAGIFFTAVGLMLQNAATHGRILAGTASAPPAEQHSA